MGRVRWIVLAALGWSGAAWAQPVPNGDFELLDEGWTETTLDCFDAPGQPMICSEWTGFFAYDGTNARGNYAGLLTGFDGGSYWTEAAITSAPFRVTHQTLSWSKYDPNLGGTSATSTTVQVFGDGIDLVGFDYLGPASVDQLVNWEKDVSEACGAEVQIRVSTLFQEMWVEDFALTGPICAEFVDGDGDGACPQGIDLDGDGTCLGVGEPTYGTFSDCDDTDPGVGACLVLSHGGWATAGSDFVATVTGAWPGDVVHLIASEAEGAACPAILGGGCMELADPLVHLGSAVADAAGTAEIVVPLRMRTEPYTRWYLQASTLTANRTDVGEVWILPPEYGPGLENGGIFNGDMEDRSIGWPSDSASYIDYYDVRECPGARITVGVARDTQSLELQDTDQCDGEVVGWPFLVTHRTLSWANQGPLSVELRAIEDDAVVAPAAVAGPVLADDGFEEWAADLQAECGMVRYLRMRSTGWGAGPIVDDVRLGGSICAIYADRDGDGTCPSGVDLDADGFCVSDGEPDLPVYGTEIPLAALLLDFEEASPVEDVAYYTAVVPLTLFGDQSAQVSTDYWHIWPVNALVTHDQIAFQATPRGLGDWEPAQIMVAVRDAGSYTDRAAATVDLPGGPGDWSQHLVDTSAMCGDVADDIWLQQPYNSDWALITYGSTLYAHGDSVLVDEVGFAGAPCAIFVDGDGDGLCSEGVDGDGDGLCVGAGEPTPGTVQDVDDPSVAP